MGSGIGGLSTWEREYRVLNERGTRAGQPVPHHHDGPEHGRRAARDHARRHGPEPVPGPRLRHRRRGDRRRAGADPARRRRRGDRRLFRGPDHAPLHGGILRDPRRQPPQRRAGPREPALRRGARRLRDERGRGRRGPREPGARRAPGRGADRRRRGLRPHDGRLPRDRPRRAGPRRRTRDASPPWRTRASTARGGGARERPRHRHPDGRRTGDEGDLARHAARPGLGHQVHDRALLRRRRRNGGDHVRPGPQAQGRAADHQPGEPRRRLRRA